MNKLIIISVTFLAASSSVFSQTKMEKFCEVTTRPKNGFTIKRVAVIYFGEQLYLFNFKDSTVITNLQKVNNFTSDADVLNYMSGLGWQFVTVVSTVNSWENFYFKKEFDKSELAGQ